MDRGARRATVHGVAKSRTWLSTHTSMSCFVLHARGRQRHSLFNAGTLQEFHKPIAHRVVVVVVQSPSHVRLHVTPWTAACQVPLSLTISRSLPKFMSITSGMPSSHLIHPLMSSSPSSLNLSQHQGLFQWVGCPHQMTKILEHQLQHQSFQWIFRADFLSDWLVGSPCSPRDSGVFSTPQLKSINSLALLLLHGPALTTVHDQWEDYSLDLCQWVMSLFLICCLGLSKVPHSLL